MKLQWIIRGILPFTLAKATRQPRYLPEIEWSNNSWTHNIFRLFELIFWRRYGIRVEMSSAVRFENGQKIVEYEIYSLEALCAYIETWIREFLSLHTLSFKLSQVALVTNPNYSQSKIHVPGIFFAIALDTSTQGVSSATSPITWSHTCTGSNLILFMGTVCGASSPTVSVPTYNSVSGTLVGSQRLNGSLCIGLYYLIGPATGANTVSCGFGGTIPAAIGTAISYSGAKQSGQPDAVSGNTGGTANPSLTVTTIADNCWCVGLCGNSNVAMTAGLTSRQNLSVGGSFPCKGNLEDTNAVVTPAGNQTVNWTLAAAVWGAQAASIAPAAAATLTYFEHNTISQPLVDFSITQV